MGTPSTSAPCSSPFTRDPRWAQRRRSGSNRHCIAPRDRLVADHEPELVLAGLSRRAHPIGARGGPAHVIEPQVGMTIRGSSDVWIAHFVNRDPVAATE